jgi:uncharacterized protein YktB (UPF0637 family)
MNAISHSTCTAYVQHFLKFPVVNGSVLHARRNEIREEIEPLFNASGSQMMIRMKMGISLRTLNMNVSVRCVAKKVNWWSVQHVLRHSTWIAMIHHYATFQGRTHGNVFSVRLEYA